MIHSFGDILIGKDYGPIWGRLWVPAENEKTIQPLEIRKFEKNRILVKHYLLINEIRETAELNLYRF